MVNYIYKCLLKFNVIIQLIIFTEISGHTFPHFRINQEFSLLICSNKIFTNFCECVKEIKKTFKI